MAEKKCYCPTCSRRDRVAEKQQSVEPITWLEHHDRLIAEFFDGQRKLLGDLYGSDEASPDGSRLDESRPVATRTGSRRSTPARWGSDLAEFGRVLGFVILVTAAVVWANWVMQIFGR